MANQRKAGAALGYANVIAKNLVNLMYVPLLLHFVGQGDYGVFQMTNSVVFALTLLSAGFSGAYVRFYMREVAHGTRTSIRRLNGIFLLIYMIVVGLCFVGGVILILNVDMLFSKGLSSRELVLARELMVLMVFNVAAQLMTSPFNSYITAKERFVYQQTRQLLTTLVQPLLAVLLVWRGMGAIGVALAMLVVTVALLVMNIVYAIKKLGMHFSFTGLQWSMFKAIAIFSFWIFLNQIFDLVNNNVPNFLLGAMAGSTVVATFSIAVQIRNIFFAMSTTMSNVFIPQINRIVADSDDNKVLTELMTRVGRYQMAIFWFIYGGFVVLGQFFVVLWAGRQNVDAYWLAVIMVLPVMIPLTQNTGIEIQRAKNRHKTRSVIYVFTAMLDVILSVLLIPSMGYWATAIGYIASIMLGTGLFMNWYYQTHIGLDMLYFWRNQMPTIIMAVLVTGACLLGTHFVPVNSIPLFLMWGVVYVILFCAGAFHVSLTAAERTKVLSMLHKMKKA
ncbi:lipopolysaccharide biosynthesis protein [Bifidobacterium adolescentis]|jgi:O-antigen/teichoic acid export membrane protein|uniref:lipopolysaccharide biosynthesis protein n=1 Tax=Bifidobacterium adolescentis TaxID=1680 RepID=UPI001C227653|nr:oligosaccharide flippase family protein [Bifidobacterium adolescentis]MBU9011254.1 oligosaccharide flippase family protein [Bifidobacterium adolescentis]MBU9080787.1 oligosaccharide flippase family protein [Bifidobacterium adolescentis]MBU9102213.1 oligosaccharide flippase family protein [Bifidobacterium adolescentis]MBU9104108.1 oligosaccharide flippase family protein [Bifidobacterium adolescentis]